MVTAETVRKNLSWEGEGRPTFEENAKCDGYLPSLSTSTSQTLVVDLFTFFKITDSPTELMLIWLYILTILEI